MACGIILSGCDTKMAGVFVSVSNGLCSVSDTAMTGVSDTKVTCIASDANLAPRVVHDTDTQMWSTKNVFFSFSFFLLLLFCCCFCYFVVVFVVVVVVESRSPHHV